MDAFSKAIDLINQKNAYTVFIDDTGTDGIVSYAAVIISPDFSKYIIEIMNRVLKSLNMNLKMNVSEFHFKDIYQGRGEFEGIELKIRYQIFNKFVDLFSNRLKPAIFLNSVDEKATINFFKENNFPQNSSLSVKLTSHALGNLIERIDNYLSNVIKTDKKAILFCDSGFKKSGTIIPLGLKLDSIFKNSIFFIDSKVHPGVQLADFAAFTLNRHQVLSKKKELNNKDKTFILLTQELKPFLKNTTILDPKNITLDPEYHLPFIIKEKNDGKSNRINIIADSRTGFVAISKPKKDSL